MMMVVFPSIIGEDGRNGEIIPKIDCDCRREVVGPVRKESFSYVALDSSLYLNFLARQSVLIRL